MWRVLLGYLPRETAKWETFLKQQKAAYEDWRKELIVEPYLVESEYVVTDHPLSVGKDSLWSKFFKDQELWEEIEKDVRRTRSDMTFFIEAVDLSYLS